MSGARRKHHHLVQPVAVDNVDIVVDKGQNLAARAPAAKLQIRAKLNGRRIFNSHLEFLPMASRYRSVGASVLPLSMIRISVSRYAVVQQAVDTSGEITHLIPGRHDQSDQRLRAGNSPVHAVEIRSGSIRQTPIA